MEGYSPEKLEDLKVLRSPCFVQRANLLRYGGCTEPQIFKLHFFIPFEASKLLDALCNKIVVKTHNGKNLLKPFQNAVRAGSPTPTSSPVKLRMSAAVRRVHTALKAEGYLLKGFSTRFCPYLLVDILKLFDDRQAAFAFFKLVFADSSEVMVQSCCLSAHLLLSESFRLTAQDLLYWVVSRVGDRRSDEVVEYMWRQKYKQGSEFFVLDALMRAFVNADMRSPALKVLDKIRELGLLPSLSAMCILFRKQYVNVGKSLLCVMSKYGCEPDVVGYNILINAYCFRGKLSEARKIFKEILEMGISPCTNMYNTLLDGYAKAREIGEANMLYEEMGKIGVAPDCITLNILVAGNYKFGRVEDGDRFLRELSSTDLIPDSSVSDMYISRLCWAGRLDEAFNLLNRMLEKGINPNLVAFNSVIAAYGREGLYERTFELYETMYRFSLVPPASALTSLLLGLSHVGRLQDMKDLVDKTLKRAWPVNKVAFTQGRMKSAIDAYMAMPRYEIVPDIVTYNTLISGHFKVFDMISVDNIVNKMNASGWEPDITTYNICMHGFCSSRRLNHAVLILNEIVSVGIAPNTVTYNTLMNGICNDILDRALILTGKLLKMGFVPNIVTINLLLSHLRKKGSPQRTCMWYQKLSEIQYEFDEISYKIWERACDDINRNSKPQRRITGKTLFLDFLMYFTYDYISRIKLCSQKRDQSSKLVWKSSMDSVRQ
ncbi:OLC1v1000293C5 [Oldenlandia corymbosa var. corymbosa]|uniref:OLC1v1000293C5 n=1 Tax=Oldenlandia corymbosa var. corymbosa TaxID=529605 RepID=A0AAV1D614_OLDCO|nr:OLC1v1000293C5 [Oldenlandia corymbosa var. corymbosa]